MSQYLTLLIYAVSMYPLVSSASYMLHINLIHLVSIFDLMVRAIFVVDADGRNHHLCGESMTRNLNFRKKNFFFSHLVKNFCFAHFSLEASKAYIFYRINMKSVV